MIVLESLENLSAVGTTPGVPDPPETTTVMASEDHAESAKEELRAALAKNIVSARKAKAKMLGRHYTQEHLARDSGISTTAIAQIERGDVDPRLSTITGTNRSTCRTWQ